MDDVELVIKLNCYGKKEWKSVNGYIFDDMVCYRYDAFNHIAIKEICD